MKQNIIRKICVVLVVLGLMMVAFVGCSEQAANDETTGTTENAENVTATSEGTGEDQGETKLIGMSLPTKELARCLKDAEYFEQEMDGLGYEVIIQFAEGDAQLQASQIENMIMKGVDCLVISPWDGASLTQVVDLAYENDIPVVAYDALILNTPYIDYYVTDDLVKVGELQGQYIVDALGLSDEDEGPFNIELFAGDPADNNARFFFDGAMSKLNPYIESGQLVVQSGQIDFSVTSTPGWDGLKAQQRMDNLISANYTNKKIDAVLCNNDGLALGVISALKTAGYGTEEYPYPVITGQDCDIASIKSIIAEEQTMTVFKDIRILAHNASTVVNALLNGETIEADDTTTFDNGSIVVPATYVPPVALDISNYQELLFDSGYYSEDLLND